MWYAVLIVFFLIIIAYLKRPQKPTQPREEPADKTNYEKAYKPRWLFSYNEKTAYKKLKEITDEQDFILFAKVRLLDLIEPKPTENNNKGAMWKIQAKHVDFVICDQKLVARFIVELDDASHEEEKRKERDRFVDTVLQNCGYTVLHTNSINAEEITALLKQQT